MNVLESISGFIRHKLYREDMHYPMVVVGDPGIGKSSTSLALCDSVDESFEVDRVAFLPTEFLELAKDIERGQGLMMDEAGLGLHARQWQSLTNIIFSKLTQVYRFLNIFVVFTVPDITYIDSHARNEMKAILELYRKDIEKEVTIGHWWVVKRSRVFGTTTLEKLKFINSNGDSYEVDPVEIPRPPIRLWRAYHKKATAYKRRVIDELHEELERLENSIDKEGRIDGHTLRRLLREEQALIRSYEYLSKEIGLSDREIARIWGISHQTLPNWKAVWSKKSEEVIAVN